MPSTVSAPSKSFTNEDIQSWLKTQIGKVVRVAPEEVDTQKTFSQYGIDSMQAARLSGDLESWVGRELSPSLVYDFPTIDTLARHLATELASPPPAV